MGAGGFQVLPTWRRLRVALRRPDEDCALAWLYVTFRLNGSYDAPAMAFLECIDLRLGENDAGF